jgi:hypothetical protein
LLEFEAQVLPREIVETAFPVMSYQPVINQTSTSLVSGSERRNLSAKFARRNHRLYIDSRGSS